jgi:oxygen-dependent protoporphyrinogen oxidase
VLAAGGGYAVELDGGATEEASVVAVATPPRAAATLLADVAPAAAAEAGAVRDSAADATGVVVRAERVAHVPPATFLIPLAGDFYSVVTRDVVPHADLRGFVFHFKPGATPAARLERVTKVLGVAPLALERVEERRTLLPSPAVGHAARVAAIDRALAGTRLAVTGNWFGGLALEDCVLRSRAEWRRVYEASRS